jgi:hypothetical protein
MSIPIFLLTTSTGAVLFSQSSLDKHIHIAKVIAALAIFSSAANNSPRCISLERRFYFVFPIPDLSLYVVLETETMSADVQIVSIYQVYS